MPSILNKWILIIGVILLPGYLCGQFSSSDLDLVQKKSVENHKYDERIIQFMNADKSFFAKYNPVNLALGSLMFSYQKFISPQFSASCLYSPSCSHFSKEVIHQYGFVKGVALSADRLMRCNRVAGTSIQQVRFDHRIMRFRDDASRYRIKDNHHHE